MPVSHSASCTEALTDDEATMPTLLSLPCELLGRIAHDMWEDGDEPDKPSLASLALTCRALRIPAQKALFRGLGFRSLDDVPRGTRLLEENPHLAVAVRALRLAGVRCEEPAAWWRKVEPLLNVTRRVAHLSFSASERYEHIEGNKMPQALWQAICGLPLAGVLVINVGWPELCRGLAGIGSLVWAWFALSPPNDTLGEYAPASQPTTSIAYLVILSEDFPPDAVFSWFSGFRWLRVSYMQANVLSYGPRCHAALAGLVGLQVDARFDGSCCKLVPQLRYLGVSAWAFDSLTKARLRLLSDVEVLSIDWFWYDDVMDWPNDRRMKKLRLLASKGSLRKLILSGEPKPSVCDEDDRHDDGGNDDDGNEDGADEDDVDEDDDADEDESDEDESDQDEGDEDEGDEEDGDKADSSLSFPAGVEVIWVRTLPNLDDLEAILEGRA